MNRILKSYFYWTYTRGSFHYDVMVTLILLFIFLTPHIPGWDYGDKPSNIIGPSQPIEVIGNDGHGLIITVHASDVNLPAGASDSAIKKALRKAIEPVTGDAVTIDQWEIARDPSGNATAWKVWARR
jgi:hypothetical protein